MIMKQKNIVKISILPKAVYKFSAISVNIPMIFSQKEKTTPKFVWNHKTPLITKSTWSKKNKSNGITIPNFKLYHKAIVIKTIDSGKKQKLNPMKQNQEH